MNQANVADTGCLSFVTTTGFPLRLLLKGPPWQCSLLQGLLPLPGLPGSESVPILELA